MPTFFKRLFSKFFRKSAKTPKQKIGMFGESAAAKFLKKKGLKIIERNWRTGKLEIDIIAYCRRTNQMVFVEVKTRAEDSLTDGYYAAKSRAKRHNIKLAAFAYMKKLNRIPSSWRYDIVDVLHDGEGKISKISHFENSGF